MTQADVARVLDIDHGLKLHATAIAKMEQRDVERPRAIRLSEARAIADMFGLTIDEMASAGESEVQAVLRDLQHLSGQADKLTAETEAVMSRLNSISGIMGAPAEQLTPELLDARRQIMQSLERIDWGLRRRGAENFAFMQEWNRSKQETGSRNEGDMEPDDLRALKTRALTSVWIHAMREMYPGVTNQDIYDDVRVDKGDSAYRLAAIVAMPEGIGGSWISCAVMARGLWGHGVAVELDERISKYAKEHAGKGVPYIKRAALGSMAADIEEEIERKLETISRYALRAESVWHDVEGLRAFVAEAD